MKYLKTTATLATSFILGIAVLIGLQYAGNLADDPGTSRKIELAFERGNLTNNSYNGRKLQYQTSQSLLGIDNFPDCQIYLSILIPTNKSLEAAIVPPMYRVKDAKSSCDALEKVVSGKKTPYDSRMKVRYWWGSKVVASLAFSVFTAFQTIQLLKILTLSLYFIIAFLLYEISSRFFYVFLPVLIYGFFFSGTMYFGGIALSLPYMWTLLCFIGLLVLIARKCQSTTYQVFFLLSGLGSAYIFLLDGHIVFMLPMYIILIYFLVATQRLERQKYVLIVWYLTLYSVGLFGGIIADQVLSMIYLDPGTVINGFTNQLAFRLSDSYPDWISKNKPEFGFIDILKGLIANYRHVGAYNSQGILWILFSGAVTFVLGLSLASWHSIRNKNLLPLLNQLPFLLAVGIFFVRFALLKNHSAIHPHFLSRYMFVPFSLGWAMFVMAWLNYKGTLLFAKRS